MENKPSGLEHFKDKLKIRHTPKPEKEVSVKIKKNTEPTSFFDQFIEKDKKEDADESEEKSEEELKHNKPHKKINIVDKTKTSAIDRDLILKSIRDAKRQKLMEKTTRKEDAVLSTKNDLELIQNSDDLGFTAPKVPVKPSDEEKNPKPKPTKKITITKKVTIREDTKGEQKEEHMEHMEHVEVVVKPPTKRKLKIVSNISIKEPLIDDLLINGRLPPMEKTINRVSNYYMTNRKLAMTKLQQLFEPERVEFMKNKETVSCDSTGSATFDLLPHQKIAREYLNLYTPYRGLLLYFSLGSGKSCTSIAIAEGMKSDKRIFIMTPASLKMNFFTELKKCGDKLFKKDQFWEFVSTD